MMRPAESHDQDERRIVILGSCVTRDSIELLNLKSDLHYYHARSNLASMAYAMPLDEMPRLRRSEGFEARCAIEDMTKTIDFSHRGKLVIFDFIDDRMPIGQKNGRCFTYNWRILDGEVEGTRLIRHFAPRYRPQMTKIIERFYQKNEALFRENRIVIHNAKYNPHFDGPRPTAEALELMNSHFEYVLGEIMRVWKVDRVLDLNEMLDGPAATPQDHRWGHKPFHYCEAYQTALAERIREEMHQLPVRA